MQRKIYRGKLKFILVYIENRANIKKLNEASKILLIEQDEDFLKLLHLELAYRGIQADFLSYKSLNASKEASSKAYKSDLVVLGVDDSSLGAAFSRELRSKKLNTWLIILSKNLSVKDKVLLLEAGADDCFQKPFSNDELVAKLKSAIRRLKNSANNDSSVLEYADLKMDLVQRTLWRGGRLIELRTKEFDLLRVFMNNPERVLTHEFIFDNVWGSDFMGNSNVIEVYVRYLRSKLDKPNIIKTHRGRGYMLISEDAQIKKVNTQKYDEM